MILTVLLWHHKGNTLDSATQHIGHGDVLLGVSIPCGQPMFTSLTEVVRTDQRVAQAERGLGSEQSITSRISMMGVVVYGLDCSASATQFECVTEFSFTGCDL